MDELSTEDVLWAILGVFALVLTALVLSWPQQPTLEVKPVPEAVPEPIEDTTACVETDFTPTGEVSRWCTDG